MGPFNRGVYTKDIFCKQKRSDRPNLLGLGPQSAARSPRRIVSRVGRDNAKVIGYEAEARRQLRGRRTQRDSLGPGGLTQGPWLSKNDSQQTCVGDAVCRTHRDAEGSQLAIALWDIHAAYRFGLGQSIV